MKVYIFMIKAFFVKDGIDTAMAVDNIDTKVFKRYSDACVHRQKVFDSCKEINELLGIFSSDWFGKDFFGIKRKDGSRVVFEIIEKELC